MFGWDSHDWGNYLGFRGIPGMIETQNSTLAGLLGGGQGGGQGMEDFGGGMNLSELLSMMNRGGGPGSGGGQNPYIGGQGLI